MIRQIEEGDTKGGIIIPEDKFKEFVEFQKRWMNGRKSKENVGHPKEGIYEPCSDIPRCPKSLRNGLKKKGLTWK